LVGYTSNVFVRNIASGSTKLVSMNLLGDGGGSDISFNPLFSPDDRWIVFASGATNLTTSSTGSLTNLFARDLLLNTTRMISVGPESGEPLGYSRGLTFSANSRYAAFVISNNSIAIYDFVGQTNLVVCTGCDHPTISADGRLVVYETILGTASKNIILKDLQTGATSLMSRSRLGPGGGNDDSTSPLISSDGRYVVFASKASDLVENDTNQVSDIFVRDRLLGTTLLASQNLQGNAAGNGVSSNPILGADGRTVVFQSFASDLVAGDFNDDRDVFVLRLGGVDSDGDGMDDDWEMAYFGTLARDGAGDFDGDGLTDHQEFLAGTDPTNSGSILRVMTVSSLGGGATLIWSAVPGRTYQVQFKDNINDLNWSDVGGPSTASSTTGSLTDPTPSSSSHRFYRVILAQ
jgi:Tol biopolymer transport system component